MSNYPAAAPPSYGQAVSGYPAVPDQETQPAANPPYPVYQMPQSGPQYAYPAQPAYPPPQAPGTYQQQGTPGYVGGQQPYGTPYQSAAVGGVGTDYRQGNACDDEQVIGSEQLVTDWAGGSFSDKKIRQTFIRKVYLILMTQLLVTFGFICFFMFCEPVRLWVRRNDWFYWCSYAVFLVTYITLVCCDNVRRRWPANIICLAIFTLAFSYMAGTITSYYTTESVLIAVGITAAVCLAISLFAIQTKIDFTMCSGLLFALCMTFIFFGFACMIVYIVSGPNRILQCVYGALGALLFSLFLVFDTQMVVGGQKRRYQLSPEEHIYGALQLYLDIVYIFLMVLSLVGGGRRS